MQDDQEIGQVYEHVQGLPDFGWQMMQPKIVTGDSHKEKYDQRKKAQCLKRELRNGTKSCVGCEQRYKGINISESMKLKNRKAAVDQGDRKHGDPEMPPVIE